MDYFHIVGLQTNYPYPSLSLAALNYGTNFFSYQWLATYQSYLHATHNMPKVNWLMRWRRRGNQVYMQHTNSTELNVTQGTWVDVTMHTWRWLFRGVSITGQSPSTFRLKHLIMVNDDATESSLDAEIRAKLKELEGIDL